MLDKAGLSGEIDWFYRQDQWKQHFCAFVLYKVQKYKKQKGQGQDFFHFWHWLNIFVPYRFKELIFLNKDSQYRVLLLNIVTWHLKCLCCVKTEKCSGLMMTLPSPGRWVPTQRGRRNGNPFGSLQPGLSSHEHQHQGQGGRQDDQRPHEDLEGGAEGPKEGW